MIDASRNEPQPRVLIEREIVLYCYVSGHPVPTLTWLKDGTDVVIGGHYSLVENGQGLKIADAEPASAGRYTCAAANDAGRREHDLVLDVLVPPTVSISGEEPVRPMGEQIVMHCQAAGSPQPTLHWLKDDQLLVTTADGARITADGGRLDIPRLHKTDVGVYKCVARNEAGVAEAAVSVDVLGESSAGCTEQSPVPPTIRREGLDMNPRISHGQTLTLRCEAEGKPVPKVTWTTRAKNESVADAIVLSAEHSQRGNIEVAPNGAFLKVLMLHRD